MAMPSMVVVVDMVEVTVVDTHQRKRVVVVFLLDLNATRVVHKASTVDMVEMMMKMKATVDMLVVVVLVLAHLTIHDMVLEQLDYEAHRSGGGTSSFGTGTSLFGTGTSSYGAGTSAFGGGGTTSLTMGGGGGGMGSMGGGLGVGGLV